MTREPPGADSPGPERRPPDGRQWRRWTRPRAIPGTSSAGTSQVSTRHCGWIRSKKEDLQHERLRLDQRWDFPQRIKELTLYKQRGWEGGEMNQIYTRIYHQQQD